MHGPLGPQSTYNPLQGLGIRAHLLRMVSWNPNTMRFVSVMKDTPNQQLRTWRLMSREVGQVILFEGAYGFEIPF